MDDAAVVPDHQVTQLPAVSINKFDMLTVRMEKAQNGITLGRIQAVDVCRVGRADVERFSA